MAGRTRSTVGPAAPSDSTAFIKARKALDQAARLERSGDLLGAIRCCREGIASVADADDVEGLQLRIRLRMQCEAATRLHREAQRSRQPV
ncbi:MAG TPA: hypothetical protein PLU39_11690 [Armatimonadota bacterium]|nr:hypothetical protein [Armatimonadota bacterium]HOM83297.1 hypothetical protein [Armatimonadota bacterium]HOQ30725.1 hypothetical protein [Armatimonadota bacterium]HPO72433.1 hypothetical protein [Armatimonadota bacterium]HPT98520.1 hypothetical protein [Armatimonadota bacterium]